jgi:predicted dehydrogenase
MNQFVSQGDVDFMVDGPVVRPPLERETIRVGVIGLGFGASVHVPALRRVPGVEVTALCGTSRSHSSAVAQQLDIPVAYSDYREMLASGEIDAVTIAAPPHLHHPMALAACEAGVHVLCEKPMARNVAEARDMLRMAREAGVCHAIGHHHRHDPARRRMKQLIDEGFIGQLHSVTILDYRSALADPDRRSQEWLGDASRSGGILAAVGSHYVDMLRWWFGDVHAACGSVTTAAPEPPAGGRRLDADDNAAFVLRFASGAIGTVHLCYTAPTTIGEEIIATGSEGVLAIHEDGMLFGSRHGEPVQSMLPLPRGEQADVGSARHIRAFSILFGEWILAIRTGAEASPSFADGAKVQEVIDAVARSQQLSRWIDLSGNKWPV